MQCQLQAIKTCTFDERQTEIFQSNYDNSVINAVEIEHRFILYILNRASVYKANRLFEQFRLKKTILSFPSYKFFAY